MRHDATNWGLTMTDHDDDDPMSDRTLDRYLDAARDAAPLPTQALLARIQSDAVRLAPRPPPGRPVRAARPAQRLWDHIRAGLTIAPGGLATAGLAAAGLTGLWLGLAPPQSVLGPLSAVETALLGSDDVLLSLATELEDWHLPPDGIANEGAP